MSLHHFESAEVIKVPFSVEFVETFVVLSYFNYFCLICSLQTAESL